MGQELLILCKKVAISHHSFKIAARDEMAIILEVVDLCNQLNNREIGRLWLLLFCHRQLRPQVVYHREQCFCLSQLKWLLQLLL